MFRIWHVARIVIAAICIATSSSPRASGTSYEGNWWNPNESGWGVNFAHQGSIIFGSWFIYGPDGKPYWVTSDLHQNGASTTFTGTVYATSGTPYTTPAFSSGDTKIAAVGSVTAAFTGANQLTLTYTINGTSSTKTLSRFTLTSIGIAGDYEGYTMGGRPFMVGAGDPTSFTVTASANGAFFLEQASFHSGTCRFTGTYAQVGNRIAGSGTYQCSDFTTGTWSTDDLTLFDGHYLLGTFVTKNGNATAARSFMGYRFDPLPCTVGLFETCAGG